MLSAPIDLLAVKRCFADPMRTADANFLMREIASRMHEKLELVNIDAVNVLDAGCGTGADLARLLQRFPNAQVLAMDSSAAALAIAERDQNAAANSMARMLGKFLPKSFQKPASVLYACRDFADTTLPANHMDVVWSNLALHWHPQPDLVLKEWRRLLKLNGLVMFSCFGPDTLIELKHAFAEVDAYPHVMPFVDMHDFGDMLVDAGFATPVMDMEKITLRYEKLEQLFADVRALGGNPLSNRRKSLFGKGQYQQLTSMLEKMRESDGRISLSFEIVYGHAFKPQPSKLASGESIIRLDFPKKQN